MALDSKLFHTYSIKNKTFNLVDFIDVFFLYFVSYMNIGCAQHSSSQLDSVLTCKIFKYFEYLAALDIVQVNLALFSLARYFSENDRYCCSYSSHHFFACVNGRFSRRLRRGRKGTQQAALFRRERQLVQFCCLSVWSCERILADICFHADVFFSALLCENSGNLIILC